MVPGHPRRFEVSGGHQHRRVRVPGKGHAVLHGVRAYRRERVSADAARRDSDASRRGVAGGGDLEHLFGMRASVHGNGRRLERLARGRLASHELRAEVRGVLLHDSVALHDSVEARVQRVQLLKQPGVFLGQRVDLRLELADERLFPPARAARGLAVGELAAKPVGSMGRRVAFRKDAVETRRARERVRSESAPEKKFSAVASRRETG